MFIYKQFKFNSAHHLPNYNGKCEEVHGHTYKLRLKLEGELRDDGMVLDFAEIEKIVTREILEKLDHKDLNTIIEHPTAEHIAIWIWDQLHGKFPPHVRLHKVKLWETENSCVAYKG